VLLILLFYSQIQPNLGFNQKKYNLAINPTLLRICCDVWERLIQDHRTSRTQRCTLWHQAIDQTDENTLLPLDCQFDIRTYRSYSSCATFQWFMRRHAWPWQMWRGNIQYVLLQKGTNWLLNPPGARFHEKTIITLKKFFYAILLELL